MGENTLLFVYKARLTEVGKPMQPVMSTLERDEVTEPSAEIHGWMAVVTTALQLIHNKTLKNRALRFNTETGTGIGSQTTRPTSAASGWWNHSTAGMRRGLAPWRNCILPRKK
ncbi:UNVERIFIED_CONTAM: hypothetical protein FKN15_044661 [Acipenser sinensis]